MAPFSHIIGIDPAAPYVALARALHPGDLVRFEVGDVQQLRFMDGSFDRTLSLLVLNFIPDPAKALDEMIRVTRPGGTVAAAVWDYGRGMEMLRVLWDEAVALEPVAAARDERHMPFCRRGALGVLWREHRLLDVSEGALAIRTHFATFDDDWSPFLDKQGPAGAYVAALSASAREQLRLRWRRRLVGEGPDRRLCSWLGCGPSEASCLHARLRDSECESAIRVTSPLIHRASGSTTNLGCQLASHDGFESLVRAATHCDLSTASP